MPLPRDCVTGEEFDPANDPGVDWSLVRIPKDGEEPSPMASPSIPSSSLMELEAPQAEPSAGEVVGGALAGTTSLEPVGSNVDNNTAGQFQDQQNKEALLAFNTPAGPSQGHQQQIEGQTAFNAPVDSHVDYTFTGSFQGQQREGHMPLNTAVGSYADYTPAGPPQGQQYQMEGQMALPQYQLGGSTYLMGPAYTQAGTYNGAVYGSLPPQQQPLFFVPAMPVPQQVLPAHSVGPGVQYQQPQPSVPVQTPAPQQAQQPAPPVNEALVPLKQPVRPRRLRAGASKEAHDEWREQTSEWRRYARKRNAQKNTLAAQADNRARNARLSCQSA